MTRSALATALALMAGTGFCDEIVLHDGTSVKWKSIARTGQFYEVLTQDGKRLKIPATEVKGINMGEAPGPLTGATITLKPMPPVDLLGRIDAKRDAISGNWKISQGQLRLSFQAAPAVLEIPYEPPAEYDIVCQVERTDGTDFFMIGMVAGGKQFGVSLDTYEGKSSTVNNIASSGINEATVNQKEPCLKRGKPRSVVCKLRKDGLRVEVDGEKLFEVGGLDRVTPPAGYTPKSPTRLFLSAASAGVRVTKLVATPYESR